ncbi:hypothetical protein FOZ61_007373 [Perkinsus olseni]|uniref:Mei2-like C-terminal RNA recognition motif domain-containing protein n=1 Tax=Perkinsus olseni TaxID=32597 RepID=A0A7J6L9D8_PEROL|nr:hypothetical protein FOZ61_007373 [Perkinsus olseni]
MARLEINYLFRLVPYELSPTLYMTHLGDPTPTAAAPTVQPSVTSTLASTAGASTVAPASTDAPMTVSAAPTPSAARTTSADAKQESPAASARAPPTSPSLATALPPTVAAQSTVAPVPTVATTSAQQSVTDSGTSFGTLLLHCLLIGLGLGFLVWAVVLVHERWRDHYRVPERQSKSSQRVAARSKISDSQRSWNEATDTGGAALPSEVTSFDEGPPSTRRVPRYKTRRAEALLEQKRGLGELPSSAKRRYSSSPPGFSRDGDQVDDECLDDLSSPEPGCTAVVESSCGVAANVDVATTSSEVEGDDDDGRTATTARLTTVMLRNIPSRYSSKDFCEVLRATGFEPGVHYDFVYLPADFRDYSCLGYGFINFKTYTVAKAFNAMFHGLKLPFSNGSGKICQTSWARIQGFLDNVRHAQHSANHDLPPFFRPLAFNSDGKEVTLDAVLRDGSPGSRSSMAGGGPGSRGGRGASSGLLPPQQQHHQHHHHRRQKDSGRENESIRSKDHYEPDSCKFFLGGLPSEEERPNFSKANVSEGLAPYLPAGVQVVDCAILSADEACNRYAFVSLNSADAVVALLEKYYFSPQLGAVGVQIDGSSVSLKPYRRRRVDSAPTTVAASRRGSNWSVSSWKSSPTGPSDRRLGSGRASVLNRPTKGPVKAAKFTRR